MEQHPKHHRPEPPPPPAGPPEAVGRWEMLDAQFEGAATHAALLPTNKVFAYGGSALDEEAFPHPPPAEALDLDSRTTRRVSMNGVQGDLWCGGQTFLPDGRLLFAGGTAMYPPPPDPFYGGLKSAYTFDPFTETWTRLPDMEEGRWYPTLIRLEDNRVLVISGFRYRDPAERRQKKSTLAALVEILTAVNRRVVTRHEIYDPATNRWGILAGSRRFPLYPRLHLLPDGSVFYSGVFNTHYFFPGRYPSARWERVSGDWVPLGGRHRQKNREEGISLLLPLRPPDFLARILVAGGGQHNLGRIIQSTLHGIGMHAWAEKIASLIGADSSAEVIDPSTSDAQWEPAGRMHYPRIHAVGVLLPDGKVAVIGGMSRHGYMPGTHHPRFPVLHAELYDQEVNTWTVLAPQQRPRVYHSSALLLPDGSVVSMGGNPEAKVIERTIEIFYPPYLHKGERPLITHCPQILAYSGRFTLEVDRARQVRQVVLMRPEVVTHVTNTDQRLLELEFRATNDRELEVEGPRSAAHMPEGYCLLFALNQDGVPSVGKFVRIRKPGAPGGT